MLWNRCPVCLSVCPVCDVGILWPNGWTNQAEIWHTGRPRLLPHCARWGPSSPLKGAQPLPSPLKKIRPVSIVAKRSPISATAELL